MESFNKLPAYVQDSAFDIGKLKKGKASAGGPRRGRGRNRKEVEKKKKPESSAPKKVGAADA